MTSTRAVASVTHEGLGDTIIPVFVDGRAVRADAAQSALIVGRAVGSAAFNNK
jgi:hypothetical protein